MKYRNGMEVYDLQSKIDEKFRGIQRRKYISNKASAKIKDQYKLNKWNAIKSQIQQLQKPQENIKYVRSATDKEDLLDTVNRIMLLQNTLMKLANIIAEYRRVQMLYIIFQCSLTIIVNCYNLVVFLLKLAHGTDDVPLSLHMLLVFYGFHIFGSFRDIILSVIVYSCTYNNMRKTATKMDELNMYISDSIINARISQLSGYVFNNLRTFNLFGLYNIDGSLVTSTLSVTTTYIIILIQYSGGGDICKTNLGLNETQNQFQF